MKHGKEAKRKRMSNTTTIEKKRKTMAETDRLIKAREQLKLAKEELVAAEKENKEKQESALAEMMRRTMEQFPPPMSAIATDYHNTVVSESVTFNQEFKKQLGTLSLSGSTELFVMKIETETGRAFRYEFFIFSHNRKPGAVLDCIPLSPRDPLVRHILAPLSAAGTLVAPSEIERLSLPLSPVLLHELALGYNGQFAAALDPDAIRYGRDLWEAFQRFLHARALYLLNVKFTAEHLIQKKARLDSEDVLAKHFAQRRELLNTYAK